jgi:hypothetical protein
MLADWLSEDIRGMTVATATRTAAYALVTHGVLSLAAAVCETVPDGWRVHESVHETHRIGA